MVYKKIGDKIPSLSSLLLAGMLFGSCDKEASTPAPESDKNAQVAQEGDEKKKGAEESAGKSLDKALLEAIKVVYNHLMDKVAGISRLKAEPTTFSESDFEGKSAKENVERLCKSFSDTAISSAGVYPASLKDYFAPLAKLTFRAQGSGTGRQHKYAYGCALNAIASVWSKFSSTYKEFEKWINNGALEGEAGAMLKKFDDWFVQTVRSKDSVFKQGYKFYDSKKCVLLDHDRFGRFIWDKTADGQPKKAAHQTGMPAVIADKTKVWVIGKQDKDKERELKLENINKRGTGIDQSWSVLGKVTMNKIEPFPNSEKITHNFKPGADTQVIDPKATTCLSAPIKMDFTFGQCLTTLFHGNEQMDFIKFSMNDSKVSWIDINTNNDAFQNVLSLAKDTKNPDAFARSLGNHITTASTGLTDLFEIPNFDEICNAILKDIYVVNKPLANSSTLINLSNQHMLQAQHIEEGGVASQLLMNFSEVLGVPVNSLKDAFDTCVKHKNDSNLHESNATINQKIACTVLKSILSAVDAPPTAIPLIASSGPDSSEKLVNSIKELILKEMKHAIVYKEGGEYKATDVSKKIQAWIRSMGEKLVKKHTSSGVTYAEIATDASGFDIVKIVEGMESDYKALRAILTAKVVPFFSKEPLLLGVEDYKTYIPDLDLASTDIDRINGIKSDYVNKNKAKERAPGV